MHAAITRTLIHLQTQPLEAKQRQRRPYRSQAHRDARPARRRRCVATAVEQAVQSGYARRHVPFRSRFEGNVQSSDRGRLRSRHA